jgi:hypothetical protein
LALRFERGKNFLSHSHLPEHVGKEVLMFHSTLQWPNVKFKVAGPTVAQKNTFEQEHEAGIAKDAVSFTTAVAPERHDLELEEKKKNLFVMLLLGCYIFWWNVMKEKRA